MSHFLRLTHASVELALQELEGIEEGIERENARVCILKALIHGEPEYVRGQLVAITNSWSRFELIAHLFTAHAKKEDLDRLKSTKPDQEFPDDGDGDVKEHIKLLTLRVASGWRSRPDACILSSEYRAMMFARSDKRLADFASMGAPEVCLFNEYCLRIALGDYEVIGKAKELARDDSEYRDRITMAVAKAHAHNGSLARARKACEAVMLSSHRVEVLVLIAMLESELGIEPIPLALH